MDLWNGNGPGIWAVVLSLLALALLWPRHGVLAYLRRLRRQAQRAQQEDALKHIYNYQSRHLPVTLESLAGTLRMGRGRVARLVAEMVDAGLLRFEGETLALTPRGEAAALQVLRVHRLLERYLADEMGMPLGAIHDEAERQEHRLTPEQVEALARELAHPRYDPHGDPIPTAQGQIPAREATSLLAWPLHRPARILHIEDEPKTICTQILAEGLLPGTTVEVIEADERGLHLRLDGQEFWIAPVVAANIHVGPVHPGRRLKTLANLQQGEWGRVVELDCQGFARRRFMDLGLVPGTRVKAVMHAAFGEPTAYLVRGALLALRREQAQRILVESLPPEEAPQQEPRAGREADSLGPPPPEQPDLQADHA